MHKFLMLVTASITATNVAAAVAEDGVHLELQPRICTLAANDDHCDTTVKAQWHSPRDESLCLVIVGRPEVRRCWENFSAGLYQVELTFSTDLIVELRDPQLRVVAAEAIVVIREALRLRRKRRQPWNILY